MPVPQQNKHTVSPPVPPQRESGETLDPEKNHSDVNVAKYILVKLAILDRINLPYYADATIFFQNIQILDEGEVLKKHNIRFMPEKSRFPLISFWKGLTGYNRLLILLTALHFSAIWYVKGKMAKEPVLQYMMDAMDVWHLGSVSNGGSSTRKLRRGCMARRRTRRGKRLHPINGDEPPNIVEMGGGGITHKRNARLRRRSRTWKFADKSKRALGESSDGTFDESADESADESSDESSDESADQSFDNAMVPYEKPSNAVMNNPTNATELAERDMAMMRQFLEATQNKKEVGENLRNVLSVNTNNGFLEGVVRDYRVFRGAVDVARQEKIDALKMVAEHVEKTKQMKELTAAELNRVLVQQKHLLAMLRELRDGGGKKKS